MVQLRSLPCAGDGIASRRLHPREWLDAHARRLRRAALEQALSHGQAVSSDAVTVVLGARAWCEEFPAGEWTAEIVRQLLWLDVALWCEEFDVEVPDDIAPALWAVVTAGHRIGALAAGSDDLAALLAPLADSGGFAPPDQRQRRRRAG